MKKKLSGRGHFLRNGDRFVSLGLEIRASEAWATLSPEQRWILVDWIQFYEEAIGYGKRDISDVGFAYTHSMCKEDCARSTFHMAREAIKERRFFFDPPELQAPYKPKRYLPGDWRGWRMSPELRRKRADRERRRASDNAKRKRQIVDLASNRNRCPKNSTGVYRNSDKGRGGNTVQGGPENGTGLP